MNDHDYFRQVLETLQKAPTEVSPITIDDSRRKNAGRCMTALASNRLAQDGHVPQLVRHTTFEWNGGLIVMRNARIREYHWSTIQLADIQKFHELARDRPVVYLLLNWNVDESVLDAWCVPEHVAFDAFDKLKLNTSGDSKSIQVGSIDHQLKYAPDAPSFAPYFVRASVTNSEQLKLLEAIKTDDAIKQDRRASEEQPDGKTDKAIAGDDGTFAEDEDEPTPIFTEETVAFLQELPEHIDDGSWHEKNKRRYELVLRDPSRAMVEELRTRFIRPLSPNVASGKRHLSILKKNDYGKGGYHDHYWFAFYDPAALSKTRSVQLFVRFHGSERLWRYGLGMGHYCDEYLHNILTAFSTNRKSVSEYVRRSPDATIVRLFFDDTKQDLSPTEFADRLAAGDESLNPDGRLTSLSIIREFDLGDLPDHAETLVDEVGEYFTWAWPLFDAAVAGTWNLKSSERAVNVDETGEVDESAPSTIAELASNTALPEEFLTEMEDTLWAKRQIILVGPPGTSKTFIARQFARYFVRQRLGHPQGSFDVLYMHANWGYEDFFEGLKPESRDGVLKFEPHTGFFLKWVEGLKKYSDKARHVLVLDEINRCDTAAVLGELLQLMEYRDSTVPLLSGRSFVLPSNVFIIGTMNSADRSIGRMDLALQRRFMWLDLHPQVETLKRWLERPSNNPLGFKASALEQCNELLADCGIPPEQHIGHALFMLQRRAEDDEVSPKLDKPLRERQLRQIVKFSVIPYVREVLTMHCGQADQSLLQQMSSILLECLDSRQVDIQGEQAHDESST